MISHSISCLARIASNWIRGRVHLVALALLNFVDLQPGIREGEGGLRVGELCSDLLLLPLKRAGDVLQPGVEGLLLRNAGDR